MEREMEIERAMGWGKGKRDGMGKWKEGWDGEMEREMEIERGTGWENGKRDGNRKRDGMWK